MLCGGSFDIDVKQAEIAEREQLSEQPGFWDDGIKAQAVMQEIAERKEWIAIWQSAKSAVDDAGHTWRENGPGDAAHLHTDDSSSHGLKAPGLGFITMAGPAPLRPHDCRPKGRR